MLRPETALPIERMAGTAATEINAGGGRKLFTGTVEFFRRNIPDDHCIRSPAQRSVAHNNPESGKHARIVEFLDTLDDLLFPLSQPQRQSDRSVFDANFCTCGCEQFR